MVQQTSRTGVRRRDRRAFRSPRTFLCDTRDTRENPKGAPHGKPLEVQPARRTRCAASAGDRYLGLERGVSQRTSALYPRRVQELVGAEIGKIPESRPTPMKGGSRREPGGMREVGDRGRHKHPVKSSLASSRGDQARPRRKSATTASKHWRTCAGGTCVDSR